MSYRKDYLVEERPHYIGDGVQRLYRFPNGYGASVVRFTINGIPVSYGAEDGLWELAVLKWNENSFSITYETSITDDVIGHLSEDEVQSTLEKIRGLQ